MLGVAFEGCQVFAYSSFEAARSYSIALRLPVHPKEFLNFFKQIAFSPQGIILIDEICLRLVQKKFFQQIRVKETLKSWVHVASVADVRKTHFSLILVIQQLFVGKGFFCICLKIGFIDS